MGCLMGMQNSSGWQKPSRIKRLVVFCLNKIKYYTRRVKGNDMLLALGVASFFIFLLGIYCERPYIVVSGLVLSIIGYACVLGLIPT